MGYWKSKVLPKIKKVFENKTTLKKAAAAEAAKSFDDSKAEIEKEFEQKKTELQPRVLELYEAAPAEIKALVKERTDAGVKKNSAAVANFLDELAKIEFPGSNKASEIAKSYGLSYAPSPILFLLEKVSTFLPAEETPAAPEAEAGAEADAAVEESSNKDKEVAVPSVEDEKKEEAPAPAEVTEAAAEIVAETVAVAAEETPKA